MNELSPTQVALRELTMLTKCYCGGQRDGLGHPHPQLGNNCSFRPDVMTLVANIDAALKLLDVTDTPFAPDPWVIEHLDNVRRALLGLGATPNHSAASEGTRSGLQLAGGPPDSPDEGVGSSPQG